MRDWRFEKIGPGVSRCPIDTENHRAQHELGLLDKHIGESRSTRLREHLTEVHGQQDAA